MLPLVGELVATFVVRAIATPFSPRSEFGPATFLSAAPPFWKRPRVMRTSLAALDLRLDKAGVPADGTRQLGAAFCVLSA
jgi:hypothetical protein